MGCISLAYSEKDSGLGAPVISAVRSRKMVVPRPNASRRPVPSTRRRIRRAYRGSAMTERVAPVSGKLVDWAKEFGPWVLEIVKRSDDAKGFELLHHRWIVERTFAWLGRFRRLSKDYEVLIETRESP